jgi:hypothetical protein
MGYMTYLFLSRDKDAFMILNSSTSTIAKKRAKDIALETGLPLFNWDFLRVCKREAKKLFSQYELNTVYSND